MSGAMYLSSVCFHGMDRHNFTFPSALNRKYSVTSHAHTMVVSSTFMEGDKTGLVFMYDFIVKISPNCK